MSRGLDLLLARVAFRDRSTLDVLDLALRFLAVHARAYAPIALVVLVPCVAASVGVAWRWGWMAAWAFAVCLWLLAQTPFTLLASRLVFEPDVRVRSVLRASLKETPRIFAMRFLWVCALGIAALFFLVPVFWAFGALHFASEVMLLERASITDGFVRSQRIASASIGDAIVAWMLGALGVTVAVLLAEVGGRMVIGELFQFRPPPAAWSEGGSILCMIGFFGCLPFFATARFFVYLNVRTRVEGWDIQTRFAALAARAVASPVTGGQ